MPSIESFFDDGFLPTPHIARYSSTIYPNNKAISVDVRDRLQGRLKIFTRDQTDRGLEVIVIKSDTGLRGADSNGIMAAVTRENGNALDIAYSASDKTITGNVQDATTMAQLKTEIETQTALRTQYFGDETGTGMAEAFTAETAHGHDNRMCAVEFRAGSDAIIYIDNEKSEFIRSAFSLRRMLTPEQDVYTQGDGAAREGSISIWILD